MNIAKDGVKAIVVSSSKILLFHRDNKPTIPYPDCWHFTGGKIEEGESPEAATIRELTEEASYVPPNHFFWKEVFGYQG